VIVTTPASSRSTRIVSIVPTILVDVGFNPYRKLHRRPSDYLMVAGALLAIAAILAWAILG
jgi:hypothetical protein